MMIKKWIAGFSDLCEESFTVLEIHVRETECYFFVEKRLEVDNGKAYRAAQILLKHTMRIDKGASKGILFDSREAAINNQLELYRQRHINYTKKAAEAGEKVMLIQGILNEG